MVLIPGRKDDVYPVTYILLASGETTRAFDESAKTPPQTYSHTVLPVEGLIF